MSSWHTMRAGIVGATLSALTVLGIGIVGASSAPAAAPVAPAASVHTPPPLPPYMRHQLREEDGTNGWWNDGAGHPFYVATLPVYAADGDLIGRAVCHMYETRRIHRSTATLCQLTH